MKNNIRAITLEIDKDLWILFKEKIPRTISLNKAIIELIKEKVNQKRR